MSSRLLLGSCLWVNYKACAVAERGPSPAQGAAACIPTPILNIWQLALLSVLEWVRNTNVVILSGIFGVLYPSQISTWLCSQRVLWFALLFGHLKIIVVGFSPCTWWQPPFWSRYYCHILVGQNGI